MQPQRRVGSAGGVGHCLLIRYHREVELFRAATGDVLVAGGTQPDLLLDQVVQVVPSRADAVQHVGLEHGVVGDAAKVYSVSFKDALGTLQVVANLGYRGVFQQGLEPVRRFRQQQVLRNGEVESERHVGGLFWRCREREARDIGIGEVAPAGHHGEGA